MKLIIAGGRDWDDYPQLGLQMEDLNPSLILSGGAQGADAMAIQYARSNDIKLCICPADWSQGRQAGYVRNAQMAQRATHLLAFWNGESRGTKHMIDLAKKKGLKVRVIRYKKETYGEGNCQSVRYLYLGLAKKVTTEKVQHCLH